MREKEIEIEFRPIKKIVIFQTLELSMDELFKRMGLIARMGQPPALHWTEGMLFLYAPFHPECDVVTEEAMKGNMYWSTVLFSRMPKYEPLKKIGGIEIPIIDQTPDPIMRQVAQWLKERKEQQASS
jgi:hypothetical protein